MSIFLVVIFVIDGQMQIPDGWSPRIQPSMEICEQRAAFLYDYVQTLEDAPSIAGLDCVEAEETVQAIGKVLKDIIQEKQE